MAMKSQSFRVHTFDNIFDFVLYHYSGFLGRSNIPYAHCRTAHAVLRILYLWQLPEFCHTIILYCGGHTKGASTEDLAEKKLVVLPEVKRVNINFTIMQMLARIIDKTEE